ncbi:MAG: tetratricopeptide repeat protein [Chloroflexi bacterium]|nr:tetratricopeptide repeat protein [Chloroflexota bacterium]
MSQRLTIRLLGSVEIEKGGKPVTSLGTRKAEALVAYLACHTRPFPRELLADLLWDDREQTQALANLRSILSVLRRKLKPYLIITRQTVAFNHESDYWLDVANFEKLLEIGDWGLEIKEISQSPISNLQNAATLYRGHFLEGFHLRDCRGFEEWAILERERLQRLASTGLQRLVDDCLQHGRYPTGLEYNDQLLRLDNLSELAHRQKMELLARTGQRNAAWQHYNQFCDQLRQELDTGPSAATIALHDRIQNTPFPPPHNLPANLTPFVGRQTEMTAVQQRLLAPEGRLLTILGPGGIGKTRLTLELAHTILQQQPGRFWDGIFVVSLTAVQSPSALAAYLTDAIGLTFEGADSPQTQLLNNLQHKEMLLALDNYEHLLTQENSVALIDAILRETTAVKLIVTSRERLDLYGEILFELEGLQFPPDDAANPETFDAVSLFLQQARRVQHTFNPGKTRLSQIVKICHLLEGTPLAIELAASWIRQHSCAEIVTQIEQSLDFLRTTYHNVPARQRSLRAVFDHSWGLLTAVLQTCFARLSIFPDTFTAAAAAAITGTETATLNTLVDKSLCQRQTDDGRYQIHPLLRQYAAEKLSVEPDSETAAAQQHASYYLDLLANQGSGEDPEQRSTIRADLPNIRAAWGWAAQQKAYVDLEKAATPLHGFYSVQSWFQEGIETFQLALANIPTKATPGQAQALCNLLGRTARMNIHIGQINTAKNLLDTARRYLPDVTSPERRSTILGYLAITTFYTGDYGRATDLAQQSLQLSLATDDLDGIAFGYNFMGSCAKAEGNYEQARHYFEQAVSAYRQNEDHIGAAMVLNNLGNLTQAQHQYELAQAYYLECAAIFQAHDHVHGAATTLANAGRLALKQAEYENAQTLLQESLLLKQDLHDERGMAVALVGLGAVAVGLGKLKMARPQLARALELAQQSGDTRLALEALVSIAALQAKMGDKPAAVHLLTYTLNHKATVQEVREQAEKLAATLGEVTAVSSTQPLDDLVTEILATLQ